MHGYDFYEALYFNCKTHSPLVGVLGPRAGQIWPYRYNVFNLIKSSSQLTYTFEIN